MSKTSGTFISFERLEKKLRIGVMVCYGIIYLLMSDLIFYHWYGTSWGGCNKTVWWKPMVNEHIILKSIFSEYVVTSFMSKGPPTQKWPLFKIINIGILFFISVKTTQIMFKIQYFPNECLSMYSKTITLVINWIMTNK